jgi:hypothetical protein
MQLLTFFVRPIKRPFRGLFILEWEDDLRSRVFIRFEFLMLDPREFLCFLDVLDLTNDFLSNVIKYLKGISNI